MKRLILFLILSICFLGCNKPNPHPETLDPIFADMQKRLAEYKKAVEEEKKVLIEHEKEVRSAKPQSGQIKYAEKRYYESKHRIEKLEQMANYYEVKIESRLKAVKKEYLKAWSQKKPWPDPQEYKDYLENEAAQTVRPTWNAGERIKKYLDENPSIVADRKNRLKSITKEPATGAGAPSGH